MPLTFLFNSKTADRGYIYYSLYNGWGKALTGNTGVRCTKETYESTKSKSAKLRNLKSTVDSYILNKQTLLQSITREEMQTFIDGLLGGDTGQIKLTVYEVLNGYYLQVNEDKIKNEGKAFSASKKRTLRITVGHLNDTYLGKKDIKLVTGEDFVFFQNYLFDLGVSRNTVSIYMLYFKFMLKETVRIHHNQVFKEPGLMVRSEKKDDAIFLTTEEILKIYNTEVPPRLEPVRDKFVYGCNIGARYSDLNENLSPESMQNNLVSIATKKTDKKVIIPMTELAVEIWNKYGGNIPKMAISSFDTKIKKVCKAAGITESIMITKTVKGKKTVTHTPKYMLVSSHTMRRSFATNALLAGVDVETVKRMMGHSDIKTTLGYLVASNKQVAEKAKEHVFFKSK